MILRDKISIFTGNAHPKLAAAIAASELSSAEVVAEHLQRIETSDLNAFTLIDGERALEAASAIDARVVAGEDVGPLGGVPVAVKVLRQAYVEDEACLARFRSQAQAVAGLVHPNIVTTYEAGQEGDMHYLVMELVEEPTLQELMRVGVPVSIKQALDIVIQICTAVGYAHRLGMAHGDIRPQTLADAGQVCLDELRFPWQSALTVAVTAVYLDPVQAMQAALDYVLDR